MRLVREIAKYRLGAVAVLIAVTIWFARTPHFFEAETLFGLTRQYAEIGIVAVGMTLVIATGGIDISVGGTAGMVSMLLGFLAVGHGWNIWAALGAAMICALGIGAVNGFAIARLGMEPVLVTLATMSLTRGIAYVLTQGTSLSLYSYDSFRAISSTDVALPGVSVPTPAIILLVTVAVAYVLLRQTVFGRQILALGQSEAAAKLAGIPVTRAKFQTYLLLSLLAGLAGALISSRSATAFADAGRNYEFEAITAVVLGGTSLSGGEGSLIGTLIGVATMAALRNGLALTGQSDLVRTQMLAVALIAAVVIDNARKKLIRGGSNT
ncbi:MAG: ABC transporter permease [Armatimonadetes bacterium]|nr:ABC transporter permease [Armatimonadota bacterium]